MRIAIVNDVAFVVESLRRVLVADGRHTLAWTAHDGEEAVGRCEADTPDLILMDLIMPVMDGVEATRRIMERSPCAILVVTATVEGNAAMVYEALGAGALDAVETPAFGRSAAMLLVKLDLLQKRISMRSSMPPFVPNAPAPVAAPPAGRPVAGWLAGIGASAGGPAALATLLSALSADFPGAIVVVQHIDAAFVPGLISWLALKCRLPVHPAGDGLVPEPGRVYVAGADRHLVVDAAGRLAHADEPRDNVYLPSIDVFFQSMARHWRRGGAGVLLTGMGRDGAAGLRSLREAGFPTIAQDRATSAVYGMPKAAADLGAASQVLPLEEIAPLLCRQAALRGARPEL